MWRIWFFFGILKISFAAPVETSQEDIIPASELSVLKCLLSSPLNSCDDVKRSAEKIPKRIQKLYEKLKRPLFNTSHEVVDANALEFLPANLLYLIPKIRLASMTGFIASDIVRKFPFDDALTMKILSLFTDKTNVKNFLNGLADREEVFFVSEDETVEEASIEGIAPISPAVEEEIALSLSRWFPNGSQWEYWMYRSSMLTGTPILANLPNYFLNSLSLETTEKFLFHLRNWRWDHSKFYDSSWSQHRMSVKRIWASIVLNKAEVPERWTPKILRKLGFFLIGATPDELRQLSTDLRISHDFSLLLDLNWNALQARAVFDVGFSDLDDLNENDLKIASNVIVHLLPRQIQQFSYNSTDFGFIKSNTGISLPTEKQLFSSYLAFLISKNRTKGYSSTLWEDHIDRAGNFYHLLPSSSLEVFMNQSLTLETLAKTDSLQLSFRQVRCLSNSGESINLSKPETVLKVKGILKAVPSLKLVEQPSNMISHVVKEHLLMFSSGQSLPFIASVLEKIRQDSAQISYLEKMLYNKDFKESFNLLGSRDITYKHKDISSNLFQIVSKDPVLERNVRLLPPNTLSALLSMHRQEALEKDGGWNYENLVESSVKLYISGLSCLDIEVLEVSDFIPVIGYYVHQRRAMNEAFPKNMQYCSQTSLTKYLKLKASLRGYENEPFGLLSLLEPHEIRAVGGYILAGLPIDIIGTIGSRYQIITEIGKLTTPELLTATSLENTKKFTEMYIANSDKFNLNIMSNLGNLVWFLNEEHIHKLDAMDFKLHLESMEENAGKAFCFNEKERKAWKKLFIRVYGNPDSWSSSTLSYLGDLLFVLDGYELERINKTSWIESADVLTKSTSFFTTLDWPGKLKPISIYEACLEVLKIPEKISYKTSVKQLLRFYLESAQFLLNTVAGAQNILKVTEEGNLIENAPTLGSPYMKNVVSGQVPVLNELTFYKSTAGDKLLESQESSEDYDYRSKEENWENEEEKVKSDFINSKESLVLLRKESHSIVRDSQTVIPFKTEENSHGRSSSDLVREHPKESLQIEVSSKVLNNKRSAGDSPEVFKDGEHVEKESVNIYRSKSTKSLEELKEELQRNASRALIIEVPLNRSEFLNFGTTKREIKITCDAIKMLGKPSSLILDVEDFEDMSEVQLEDCAEVLGSLNLDLSVRKYIWNKVSKWKESGNLLEVGNLVAAIEENDISKIPLRLSDPWALENLHVLSTHITEPEMMSFITDQFLLRNMDLQALTYESAISLGRLVCTMTLSHQKKYLLSHPEVFINVAKTLGNSLDCSTMIFDSCIQQLASLATSPETFGETSEWSANDVSDLGVIVAGLRKSDWQERDGKGLKPEALAGLTPTAASCIPPEVFKVLTEKQLSHIPALSAAAVSSEQTSSLSPSQYEMIDRVRRQIPPEDLTLSFASDGSTAHASLGFSAALCITSYVTYRTFFYV